MRVRNVRRTIIAHREPRPLPLGVILTSLKAARFNGTIVSSAFCDVAVVERAYGRGNQRENSGYVGPTPHHDGCDAAVGRLATGNYRRLCERRPDALFSLRSGQSEGKKFGAR